jgi:hypothetical protein
VELQWQQRKEDSSRSNGVDIFVVFRRLSPVGN